MKAISLLVFLISFILFTQLGESQDFQPPTYSLNSTNSTLAGTAVEHRLKWNDDYGLSGYIFSFCNGTWDGSKCLGLSATNIVGNTASEYATAWSLQRKSFYANGRFWVFYSNVTHIVYKTSTDGTSWTSATAVRNNKNGGFSVWFDGAYVHYVYVDDESNNVIYYRRGAPNADGSITWSTEQIAVGSETGYRKHDPTIAVDSNGYPWIGYYKSDNSWYCYGAYVTKSSRKDGVWETAPGFPHELEISGFWYSVSVVPLTGGKVYVAWVGWSYVLAKGKLWNGTSWGSQETISDYAATRTVDHSIVAIGDDVHYTYLRTSTNEIRYRKRTYGSGWGTEEVVQSSVTSTSAPVLSVEGNNLYLFWAGSPTTNHIYYKRNVAGTWDTSPTDWITETNLTNNNRLTGFYKQYDGYLGLVYVKNDTPNLYDVKFAYLKSGWVNDTWQSMVGTENWSNVTKIINSTLGCTIGWCVYANDTSNNWNSSCQNPFTYTTKGVSCEAGGPYFLGSTILVVGNVFGEISNETNVTINITKAGGSVASQTTTSDSSGAYYSIFNQYLGVGKYFVSVVANSSNNEFFCTDEFDVFSLEAGKECSQGTISIGGKALDTFGNSLNSGNVFISVEGITTTNSTNFSNGEFHAYLTACLYPGKKYFVQLTIVDNKGRKGSKYFYYTTT
jgi:hypothetical protein